MNNNKIIVVNKVSGLTSRDVVNKLNKILNTKKIGHTGTLDPIAKGVLVCLTEKYTKLANYITNEDKEYIATIKLGIETDTMDITGKIIKKQIVKELEENKIIDILNSFFGKSIQTVPIYSAVSINGKRLYQYAINNEKIDLPKREINIKNIELLEYKNDKIIFKALVSKGTYIRSLINDICKKLGIVGTMEELIRTKQGVFDIRDSYTLEEIENGDYRTKNLEDIFDLIEQDVDDSLINKIKNGNLLNLDYDGFVLFKNNKESLALYFFENNVGKLVLLFN